jgi:hypothetical protein
MPSSLSSLSNVQTFCTECCLSLSYGTLEAIALVLQPTSGLILSIGSGSGLLKRHLQKHNPELVIEGVKVSLTNRYLSEESINVVPGTWALCQRASLAEIWMFVYPRSPALISDYLEKYGNSMVLRKIIWIGPASDWKDGGFVESLWHERFEVRSDAVCLGQSERMVIAERKDGHG